MKKCLLWLVILVLWMGCFSANAKTLDSVWIQAGTSDRVHLRQTPHIHSGSLGLYCTGTNAVVLEEGDEWSQVMIGTEKGYILNTYLTEESVSSAARQATVKVSGTLNVRSMPSEKAEVLTRLPAGTSVLVLGETQNHWCFIKAGNLYGYVTSRFLDSSAGKAPEASQEQSVPEALTGRWVFSSGVGAWQTVMTVYPDGTFWGYFSDTDMGTYASAYPKGTVYESHFTGNFSVTRKANDHEYEITVENYQFFGTEDASKIEDNVRYITVPSGGIAGGDRLSLYLPGTPQSQMPEYAQFQYQSYATPKPVAFLYNHTSGAGFIAD